MLKEWWGKARCGAFTLFCLSCHKVQGFNLSASALHFATEYWKPEKVLNYNYHSCQEVFFRKYV